MKHATAKTAALLWLALWFTAAVFARRTNVDYHLSRTLLAPGFPHLMGFDPFGRDLLTTVLRASLQSAALAALATLTACAAAVLAGASLAIAPPRPRFLALRLLDAVLAFPALIFALAWAAIRGPGWDTLAVALLIGAVPPLTRLMYARSREILSEDYILAARGLGASPFHIMTRHMIPAVAVLCRIKIPNLFAQALIAEATLSFLGVGAPIGRDTWGSLLAAGKDYLIEAPHLTVAAGIPLVLTILSLQLFNERDPRTATRSKIR